MKKDLNKFGAREKAFTLIELIVVIAIIAILASIVVVGVTGYIQKAKIARAHTELEQIWRATNDFFFEYGEYAAASQADIIFWGEDPYSVIGGTNRYLSEFIGIDWADASYLSSGCKYYYEIDDSDPYGSIDSVGIGISENRDYANGGKYLIRYFLSNGEMGYDFEDNL